MSPCHNLEPSLVARDSSRLLSVKPNEWMHLSPFYTRMHGEWLRYAKSTSQFHWRFLLVRDVRGFQVNPLCRHDITSPFPPSGNGGYVRNLDVHSNLSNKSENAGGNIGGGSKKSGGQLPVSKSACGDLLAVLANCFKYFFFLLFKSFIISI